MAYDPFSRRDRITDLVIDPLAEARKAITGPFGRADALTEAMKASTATSAIDKALGMSMTGPIGSKHISDAMRDALGTKSLFTTLPKGADPALFNPAYRSPARDVLDQIGAAHRDVKPASSRPRPTAPSEASQSGIGSVADIGRRVRAARKAMGMTQQRFADLAGVGRRFIVELEQGKPTLELGRVLAVCKAAGIKLGFLT